MYEYTNHHVLKVVAEKSAAQSIAPPPTPVPLPTTASSGAPSVARLITFTCVLMVCE